MENSMPAAYRATVVHLADGTRAECGLTSSPTTAVATALAAYPDCAGDRSVTGTVAVQDTESGIAVFGTLSGLEASATGGIHIHEGVSCATSAGPGGHYYPDMTSDPWTVTTYISDAS